MEEKNLGQLLEELHDELAKTKAVDDKGRELLKHLKTDIQNLLNEEEPDTEDSLLERLEDSVEHFEETYPNLTSMLSSLINALNNSGI